MKRESKSAIALSVFMLGAGNMHFVTTEGYERIVPRFLPARRGIVFASGVAEMACGALVAIPRTRRVGALATVGLLVAVFPANVQMAFDGGIAGAPFPLRSARAAWLRLPLQIPLIAWALFVARSAEN